VGKAACGPEEQLARSIKCPTCSARKGERCWQTWADPSSKKVWDGRIRKRTPVAHWRRMQDALGGGPDWWKRVVGAETDLGERWRSNLRRGKVNAIHV